MLGSGSDFAVASISVSPLAQIQTPPTILALVQAAKRAVRS